MHHCRLSKAAVSMPVQGSGGSGLLTVATLQILTKPPLDKATSCSQVWQLSSFLRNNVKVLNTLSSN